MLVIKKIVLALFILLISSQTQAQMRIWTTTTADEASRTQFLLNMEKNGFVEKGELLVSGLCEVAFAGDPNKTFADKAEFCKMFVYQNVLEGKTSLTVDEFRDHVWFLPDNATVAAYNAQQSKASTAVASLNTLPVVVEKPAQTPVATASTNPPAGVQVIDVKSLGQRIDALAKRVRDGQSQAEIAQLKQSVGALKARLGRLEDGGLNPQMQSEVARLMESKLADIYNKLDSLTAGQDAQNGRLNGVENNLLALDKRVDGQDIQLQATLPLGFDFIKAALGEEAAYNYVGAAKYIQVCFLIVLGGIVFLVYPFFFVQNKRQVRVIKSALVEMKSDVMSVEEKVEEISVQIADHIAYDFDASELTKEQMDNLTLGESFELVLTSKDFTEDSVVLTIEKTGDYEITIHGIVRKLGNKAPVKCGVGRVLQTINRAIREGRLLEASALRAVA